MLAQKPGACRPRGCKPCADMLVNADLSRRAVVTPDEYTWVASPQTGVDRMMLDRDGGERARATSLVRYAPDSFFPPHAHPQGEEILVLSGVFSEAEAHFPAGWYLRNPPGSSHQPASAGGALIFVKLRHMKRDEREPVRVDTNDERQWRSLPGGGARCYLFSDASEAIGLLRLPAGATLPWRNAAELFVLEGELQAEGRKLPTGSWMRMPPGDNMEMLVGAEGAKLYLRILLPDAALQRQWKGEA